MNMHAYFALMFLGYVTLVFPVSDGEKAKEQAVLIREWQQLVAQKIADGASKDSELDRLLVMALKQVDRGQPEEPENMFFYEQDVKNFLDKAVDVGSSRDALYLLAESLQVLHDSLG